MSTISKNLSGFIFNGAALALTSAPWKDNVRAIYGFTGAGNGYQVFKPANQFNSLTQLVPDGVYIVEAATLGFELPGAVLTAASPVVAPAYFAVNKLAGSSPNAGELRLLVNYSYAGALECGVQLDGQFYNNTLTDAVGDGPAGQDVVSRFTGLAAGPRTVYVSLKNGSGTTIFNEALYVNVG